MKPAILFIVLVAISPNHAWAQANDQDNSEHEPSLLDEVSELIEKEIIVAYRIHFNSKVNGLREHFELTEEQSENLDKLVEKVALEHAEKTPRESIRSAITHCTNNTESLKNLKFNGNQFHFDESDKDSASVELQASCQNHGIWLSGPRGGTIISSSAGFHIRTDKRLREALSPLTNEQFTDFFSIVDRQFQEHVLEMVVTVLTVELLLTEKQIISAREWFEDDVKNHLASRNTPLNAARNVIQISKKEKPEFLSDAQYDRFQQLVLESDY